MSVKIAAPPDLQAVQYIAERTITEIYPHYYPKGAADYFLKFHSENNIRQDIEKNRVFLCLNAEQKTVGTVTIKMNEISRLFVLPAYQKKGFGAEMLDHAEKMISSSYPEIVLAASLPAKGFYLKRGFRETSFHMIAAGNGDFLCYDIMTKKV